METFPGRVPFSKDESFTPLRAPHTVPMQSNLSVNAQEFVPTRTPNDRPAAAAVPTQQQNFYQRQHYQRPNHHHNQHQHQQQHYQQNGYQRMPHQQQHHHQQNQQQQHHHQQQNQYQQQQRMSTLANDVQDRLKIRGGGGGGGGGGSSRGNSGNYFSQQRPSTSHQHHNNQQHHHHNHQHHHASSSNYKNNRDNNKASGGGSSGSNNTNGSNDLQTIALDYLTTVIECLNRNPGQFDTIATRFLTLFDGMENNQYVLCIAMEDIFKESTQNANFRYMGAKLYNLLHMLNLRKDSLFLTLLKCKLDYHQQEVLDYMRDNEHGKVRETALFLAELYMQLRGDDSRIQLLAENIVYSLKQLLGHESVENIRCICLTLKLAGFDLTNDCSKEVEELINALAAIEEISPGKYPIVASVLALQKNNWGRKLSSSVSMTESEGLPEPPRASDEPIFYGPDGRELTAEEADFLCGDTPGGNGGSSDDDDDDDELDLEMDEDAAKAYKEFCKLNKTS